MSGLGIGAGAATDAATAAEFCALAMPVEVISAYLAGAGFGTETGARDLSGRRMTCFGGCLTAGFCGGDGVMNTAAVCSGDRIGTSGAGAGSGSVASTACLGW